MRINLTTPLSDDKEMQRRNEVILAAIERHTEKHMNDDHTATSQPTQSDALQAENEQLRHDLERLRVEAKAQYDRGYYDGCTHPLEQSK